MDAESRYKPRNAIKIVLFLGNWLFLLFLSRRVISPPKGEIDFLIKNLGTFLFATVITGLMLRYFPERVFKISIIVAWIVAILLAIY